jgi:hypothetical protein
MEVKLKRIEPGKMGVIVDGRRLGNVEKFQRPDISTPFFQYRFLATSGLLAGIYVALDNKRSDTVEKGIKAVQDAEMGFEDNSNDDVPFLTVYDLLNDLNEIRNKYLASIAKDQEKLGWGQMSNHSYTILGQAEYVKAKLVEMGFDRLSLVRYYHGNYEDWQMTEGNVN